jgi:hypothetical protein
VNLSGGPTRLTLVVAWASVLSGCDVRLGQRPGMSPDGLCQFDAWAQVDARSSNRP